MKFILKHSWFFVFCFLQSAIAFSQSPELDSLYLDYIQTKNTDQKMSKAASLVIALGNQNAIAKAESVILELEKLQVEGQKIEIKKGLILFAKALLYRSTGSIDLSSKVAQKSFPFLKASKNYLAEAKSLVVMNYYSQGQFDSCIKMGNRSMADIKLSKSINAQIEVLLCVGRSYDFVGNRKKAIELSLEGVELAKQNQKILSLSELYISLSSIYKSESIERAKKYVLLAIDLLITKQSVNDLKYQSILNPAYLMLGNTYYDNGQLDSASYFYNLCKQGSKKLNDNATYFAAIGNLSNIAIDKKEYKIALQSIFEALKGYKVLAMPTEIAVSYGSLADLYKDLKDYKKAILYYDSALIVTKQIQSADDFIYNYKGLGETYELMGKYKDAFKYYKLYKMWNDSVNNNQNTKKINEIELNYKYKAEQREKDLIQASKNLVTQEKIKQQKYIIWAAILGGLCLVIFLGFTVKSNIQKKKTNKQLQIFNDEISEQKNIIEEKNNEITDSITYASRIQQGVIPDDEELKELLPNNFVFFKPRDIVSGDFYWASKVKSKTNPNSKRVVIAVVDCTGHGVPGAFMSLVGNTLLNQTIGRSTISNPAQALDYINVQLPKTIKSKTSTGAIKDGMEIAMCDFDFDTLTMQFAGANSNIYIVRNGVIQIYKGDKQPIGESYSGTIISYTNQIISLQKNDCVYLISDGYADQFGGEKGKKFKYKPLENIFCAIADKDVKEQYAILAKSFDDWKNNHEQVDDVLIMGIKI